MGIINLSKERVFHTIQGEGKFIGYPSVFVRTTRCNLRCAWKNKDGSITRCDTPHTSFDPEIEVNITDKVIEEISSHNCNHVVVTGGEPYFQKETVNLINGIVENGHFVTVETNGTIYRPSKASFISISPKLSSSSSDPELGYKHEFQRLNYDALEQFVLNHDYQFKFVINTEEDVREILDIAEAIYQRCQVDIRRNIWLMPQGTHEHQFDEKILWIFEICKKYDWNFSDRLHIRVWGQQKGV